MKTRLQAGLRRVLRRSFVSPLVCFVLLACGGGANNTTPTLLQANPTSNWELMTAGDIADCRLQSSSKSDAERTAQLVERQLADAGSNSNVLTLGDNAYLVGLLIGYTECYQKTWGRFINKTFAIPGNHDYESNGDGNYFDYFGPAASPGPSFGPDRSGYYRIDQSGWTIFALNSNLEGPDLLAQGQWLKKELASAKPCIAAAWHHPLFSSATDGDNAKMAEVYAMLDTAKADIVLQSHAHHYERFLPMTSTGEQISGAGMASFVVGTGGAKLEGFVRQRAGSERRIETFGVLRLTLAAGKAAFRFIGINGQMHDQGDITCRNKS
jgi:acid phosphatase type 7